MRRRAYLATLSGGVVALAGCFGDGDTDSPRSVVSAYIEAEHEGDADALSALLHSRSPLDPGAAESTEQNRSVDIDSVVVDERNLSADRLRALSLNLPAAATTTVGEATNALVEAKYEIDTPAVADSSGGQTSDRVTVTNDYVTAKENDDWLVVTFARR